LEAIGFTSGKACRADRHWHFARALAGGTHWLTNHFKDARAQFGKLIEKQNTPVSKRYFSWFWDISSTHQTCMGNNCMMRRTKWAMFNQRRLSRKLTVRVAGLSAAAINLIGIIPSLIPSAYS
jgi:hypothetical protein